VEPIVEATAGAMAAALRAGEIGPVELLERHIERIEHLDRDLNAIVVSRFAEARAEARSADAELASGRGGAPLRGVPFTVKESIDVAGMPTTAGLVEQAGNVATEDAPAVAAMRAAGAILIGKTNVAEALLFYDSRNPLYGQTRNPHDRERGAGGSSGGEAAAIAAAMSPWGLGSDLGSSIRNPAHFTGIFGLLPSVGAIPATGSWPPDATPGLALMSRVGPMARSAEDLELMLRTVAAPGTAAAEPTTPSASVAGLAVAAFSENEMQPTAAACREAVRRAAAVLADSGHDVAEEPLPNLVEVRQCFDAVVGVEAMVVWPPYVDPEREHEDHLAELIRMPPPHTPPTAEDRLRISVRLGELERECVAWQERRPIAICPVAPTSAPPAGGALTEVDGEPVRPGGKMPLGPYANALGLPAAAVPVLSDEAGLPIGIQVIGRRGRDLEVLAVAQELERALGGWIRPPL
jgi:Asp-tRNA(Asn)/Glu-tRNA(Gln) amidotransferase A subunit family amidase